jgi:serine/threonine protein kinase
MFIVMEYVEGETMKSKIQNRELTVDRIIEYGVQIASGLQAAHDKNIIHRDIKPQNIVITPEGRVKIMDFGLAKIKGGVKLTKTGRVVGTIGYMSPEQVQGCNIDHRADLWSFGVILYEMLTGQLPFQEIHEAAVMYKILNAEPNMTALRQHAPDSLCDLILQLLQKDPTKRISSTSEVIIQLEKEPVVALSASIEKSLAVLYFENMSLEKKSEHFCAGMTEDLITNLSKIKGLKVVSRSDVLQFRKREVNTRNVAQTLRVNYIVEGTVRKEGNKIRITAQLVDVHTGFDVWAERFDVVAGNSFDIQSEISQKITEALATSLN